MVEIILLSPVLLLGSGAAILGIERVMSNRERKRFLKELREEHEARIRSGIGYRPGRSELERKRNRGSRACG